MRPPPLGSVGGYGTEAEASSQALHSVGPAGHSANPAGHSANPAGLLAGPAGLFGAYSSTETPISSTGVVGGALAFKATLTEAVPLAGMLRSHWKAPV